jgi:hypothetical protein
VKVALVNFKSYGAVQADMQVKVVAVAEANFTYGQFVLLLIISHMISTPLMADVFM